MARDDVLERLYDADEDSFVEVRKQLARELREQGRTDEASALAALRKPPVPVFLANRLARERQLQVKRLLKDAKELSASQRRGDVTAVRAAQAQLKDDVTALVGEAGALAGKPLSDDVARRLSSTLRAAAVDPATSELLARGTLSEEVEPSGFDALAGMEIAPAARPAKGGKPAAAEGPAGRTSARDKADTRREAEREARLAQLETELDDATTALKEAERALAKAETEARRARDRVDRAQTKIDREHAR